VIPYSPVAIYQHFGKPCRLHLPRRRVNYSEQNRGFHVALVCGLNGSTLKMEAEDSSEMSVNSHQTTQCRIPEYSTLNHNVHIRCQIYRAESWYGSPPTQFRTQRCVTSIGRMKSETAACTAAVYVPSVY
jgi:hypothetical protein